MVRDVAAFDASDFMTLAVLMASGSYKSKTNLKTRCSSRLFNPGVVLSNHSEREGDAEGYFLCPEPQGTRLPTQL